MILESARALLANDELYAAHVEVGLVSFELVRSACKAREARALFFADEFDRFRDLDAQLGVCCGRAGLSAFKHIRKPHVSECLNLGLLPASKLPYFYASDDEGRTVFGVIPNDEWLAAMQDLFDRAKSKVVFADRLRPRRRAAAKQPAETAIPSKIKAPVAPVSAAVKPRLPSQTALVVLVAVYNLGATDEIRRKTSKQIAVRVGDDATSESVKPHLASLKEAGHVDSRPGNGGGYWVTAAGKALAATLPGAAPRLAPK